MRKNQMKNKYIIPFAILILLSSCAPIYRMLKYSPSIKLKNVSFEHNAVNPKYKFFYADTTGNKYLRKLRTDYGLDTMTSNLKSDFDKIIKILAWTHKQWIHSGNNTPSKSDALTILEEAKKGNNFRCVEYGIVTAAALNSIGISSRVLGLKTADVEEVRYGAGHVVAEAYSKDFGKWIFLDGQFNAIPVLNNIPLNAVELRKAISDDFENLKIINNNGEVSNEEKTKYLNWVKIYLYYFSIHFDNRYVNKNIAQINGKSTLMLVPLGAKHPTVFQRKYKIDYCLYTNNVNDFYQKPN